MQLSNILKMKTIVELRSLLRVGLLPYSMASPFGEEERKCACASPLFWWSLVAPAMSSRPAVLTAAQCETFFGLPGCVT